LALIGGPNGAYYGFVKIPDRFDINTKNSVSAHHFMGEPQLYVVIFDAKARFELAASRSAVGRRRYMQKSNVCKTSHFLPVH
jgi:hypothetical protein